MKAFILDRYGKKQVLRLGDMPEPVPGPDDVPVEVEAAGLNILDSKIRDGAFKPILPYKTPRSCHIIERRTNDRGAA